MGNFEIISQYITYRAIKLENIIGDLPSVIAKEIAEQNYHLEHLGIFDLYDRNVRFMGPDGRLYKSRYAGFRCFPESEERNTVVRSYLRAPKLAGKTMFLKAVFCSLGLKQNTEWLKWYGISDGMVPFYLTAKEMNKLEGTSFFELLSSSVSNSVRDGDKQEIDIELKECLNSKRLLLLVDDVDRLQGKKVVLLMDFLKQFPGCHIISTSTLYLTIPTINEPDINEKLVIPDFSAGTRTIFSYANRLCKIFKRESNFDRYIEYIFKNKSILSFAENYIHTPVELIYFIMCTGLLDNSSRYFEHEGQYGQLNLNDYLEATMRIRDPGILEEWEFIDFLSKYAYWSVFDHISFGNEMPRSRFEIPPRLYLSLETETNSFEEVEKEKSYIEKAMELGLLAYPQSDTIPVLTHEYEFVNEQLQSWFAAEYFCENPDIELPKPGELLSGDAFWLDFLACLYAKEPDLFGVVFEKILSSFDQEKMDECILSFMGLLWRIEWRENAAFLNGDMAYGLLSSFFRNKRSGTKRVFAEKSSNVLEWKESVLFYRFDMANLLGISSAIEDEWVEQILEVYSEQYYTELDCIFAVLFMSEVCSVQKKKEICIALIESVKDIREERLFRTLNEETLKFVKQQVEDYGHTREAIPDRFASMYADILYVLFGDEVNIPELLYRLLFKSDNIWEKETAIHLIGRYDDTAFGEIIPEVICELRKHPKGEAAEIYTEFVMSALDDVEITEEIRKELTTLSKVYIELFITSPEDCSRVSNLLRKCSRCGIEISVPESYIGILYQKYLSDKKNRLIWGELLVVSGHVDLLLRNPLYLIQMRQAQKGNYLDHNDIYSWWHIIRAVNNWLIEYEKEIFTGAAEDMNRFYLKDLWGNDVVYVITGKKDILGKHYVMLTGNSNSSQVIYRQIVYTGENRILVDMEDFSEYEMVSAAFDADQTGKMDHGTRFTNEDPEYDYLWNEFVSLWERTMNAIDYQIDEDGVLVQYTGPETEIVIIPSYVKVIDTNAFSNHKGIRGVILKDGLTEIRHDAFADMPIETVEFPKTLEKIGRNAFGEHLEDVVLYTPIQVETSALSNGEYQFLRLCSTDVQQGMSVKDIKLDGDVLEVIQLIKEWNLPSEKPLIVSFPPECRIYTIDIAFEISADFKAELGEPVTLLPNLEKPAFLC